MFTVAKGQVNDIIDSNYTATGQQCDQQYKAAHGIMESLKQPQIIGCPVETLCLQLLVCLLTAASPQDFHHVAVPGQ